VSAGVTLGVPEVVRVAPAVGTADLRSCVQDRLGRGEIPWGAEGPASVHVKVRPAGEADRGDGVAWVRAQATVEVRAGGRSGAWRSAGQAASAWEGAPPLDGPDPAQGLAVLARAFAFGVWSHPCGARVGDRWVATIGTDERLDLHRVGADAPDDPGRPDEAALSTWLRAVGVRRDVLVEDEREVEFELRALDPPTCRVWEVEPG
jgi:hypothetical protein